MRNDWSPHPPLSVVNGMPFSTVYGEPFTHRAAVPGPASAGAFERARTVFVDGCRLESLWSETLTTGSCTVLELGFGLGINFLATLERWRDTRPHGGRLSYVAIEKHPLCQDDLRLAMSLVGADRRLANDLLVRWPPPMAGLQRMVFETDAVSLMLWVGDVRYWLPRLTLIAQAVYLDGFGPDHNAELWTPAALKSVARLCARGTRLATSCAALPVRNALREAGFQLEFQPAGPLEHQHTEARYEPSWRTRATVCPPSESSREAVIIGAGLAGSAMTRQLLRRGWSVTLIDESSLDSGSGSGLRGSSQPACVEHLHVSPDDNRLAQLTRAAWQLSRSDSWLQALPEATVQRGKLMLLVDAGEYHRWHAVWPGLRLPETFARLLDRSQTLKRAQWPALDACSTLVGAIEFRDAAILDPHALCAAWRGGGHGAAYCGGQVGGQSGLLRLVGARADRLQCHDGQLVVTTASGECLASASKVILCNAAAARRLAPLESLDVAQTAGQSTRLRVGRVPAAGLGGAAYVCPLSDQQMLVGSTFEPVVGFKADAHGDDLNVSRLAASLQTTREGLERDHGLEVLDRHPGVRCSPADRLPVIGAWPDEKGALAGLERLQQDTKLPLPRLPGLYANFGYGARGLLWSVLGAELIAAHLCGEPLPLSADHAAALDPARALRRWLRTRSNR